MTEKTKYAGSAPENDNHTPELSGSETATEGRLNEQPSIDYFKLMFRGGLSGFLGFTVSGLISGIAEGAEPGFSTEFGSIFSLGLSGVLMISFWILFTHAGPYKND